MKNKSLFKRALSAVLCAVMLVSCWVFTAPSANAAVAGPSSTYGDTTPGTSAPSGGRAGKYMVRILIIEGDKLDKTPHDNNKNYTSGLCYGSNDTDSKRNLTSKPGFNTTNGDKGTNKEYWCEYAKISYKSTNGTGSDGAAWFNLGDYNEDGYDNIISGGGYNYGYFPSNKGILIDGFPTAFTTRYVDHTQDGWFGAKTTLSYTAYLQVAKWTSNTTYEWTEGTCTNGSGWFSGGWDSQYAGGIASGNCSVQNNNSGVECKITQTVADAKYPVAQSTPTVSYSSDSVTAPSTSSASAVTNALSFTAPTDQYGAYMATSITTSCSNKATGITQSGKTTSVGYTANIAGDTDSQTVTATVKWPQKVTTTQKSKTASFTINDAQYQVTFKNEDGTGNNLYQDNFYYGHTPEYNGTTPTKTDTANPPVYSYTHDGWSSTANGTKLTSLPAVTGDSNKTFYAHFSQSLIDYTVKFVNNENTEILSAEYHIGDTLTEPENAQIPDTYESVDKVYTFTGWVGTNGEVYTGTCQGAITYKPVYSDVPRQYTVTFQQEDGTIISSRDLDYGTVPSSVTGLVPALIDKDPDDTNHYTPAWNQSVDTGIKGDTVFKIVYTAIPHDWVSDEGVVTKEGTCTEKSIVTKTCSVCNHDVEVVGDYDLTNHHYVQASVAPVDGGRDMEDEGREVKAYVYFYCDSCNNSYCRANYKYDEESETYKYVEDTDHTGSSIDEIKKYLEEIPTPLFNDHIENFDGYDDGYPYSDRSSSFKLMKGEERAYTDENTKQDFRFSGSVKIPVDISYKIGTDTDNVITDFGYVYSQDSHIGSNPNELILAEDIPEDRLKTDSDEQYWSKIVSLSVVGNKKTSNPVTQEAQNGGRLVGAGGAWSGVSYFHNNGDKTYELTFNLVISISAKNWKMQYAARPYVKYLYHGVEYTVYDGGVTGAGYETYSHSAVFSNVVYGLTAGGESQAVLNYCKERIIPHHNDFYPATITTKTDANTDWWKKFDIWEGTGETWAAFSSSKYGDAYDKLIAPYSAQS